MKLWLSLTFAGMAMAYAAVSSEEAKHMNQMDEAIHTFGNELTNAHAGNLNVTNPDKEENPASLDAAAIAPKDIKPDLPNARKLVQQYSDNSINLDAAAVALKHIAADSQNVHELIQQYVDRFVNLFKTIEADAAAHADKFGDLADTTAEQAAKAFSDTMAESVANAEEELVVGLSTIDRLVTKNEVALNAAFIAAQDSKSASQLADYVKLANSAVRRAHEAVLTAEKDLKELIRGVETLFGAHAEAFKHSADHRIKHIAKGLKHTVTLASCTDANCNAGGLAKFAADATSDLATKAAQFGKAIVKTATDAIDAVTGTYTMHIQYHVQHPA
jgi:hypothetical protein